MLLLHKFQFQNHENYGSPSHFSMSDIFAYGDATLSKVIKQTYNLDDKQLDKQLDKIVNNWSPYRTLVCKALWNYNDTILNQTLNRI